MQEEKTLAYQALYRVYRPRTFEDMIGQEVITQTLKNAIETHQTGHAYLFSGPRGTGKTGQLGGFPGMSTPSSVLTACLAGEDTCSGPSAHREPSSIPGEMPCPPPRRWRLQKCRADGRQCPMERVREAHQPSNITYANI